VFGSATWAHILDKKRKALQPKSGKFFFVGYSKDVKGCILLQPHSNEIIPRRDVILTKMSRLGSLIRHLFHLWTVSHLQFICHPLFTLLLVFLLWFLLYMLTVRMKIHLHLLTYLQLDPLNITSTTTSQMSSYNMRRSR
jgi:hypothetical protein